MQYRKFGKLDWQVSTLGFGAMRLPNIDGDPGRIDVEEATRMLHHAIDQGVNYVDTAYPYHQGTSETFLGQALQGGYRERVHLVSKLPVWLVEKSSDLDRFLDEQLERLQTSYLDLYLLHGLGQDRWDKVREMKVLDWAERQMAAGRFHHLGFSFHDTYEVFTKIIDSYDNFVMAQVQYNLMDVDYQAGTRGVQYATSRGLAVVVMEPIRGGMLAGKLPTRIMDLWDSAPVQRKPADWALRWVMNHPEVSVVLSGMSSMQQLEENLATANNARPDHLSADELALIGKVRDAYLELAPIPCTRCEYCLPCPNGVNIPRVFELYNEALMYSDYATSRMRYQWLSAEQKASACVECGTCETLCPQSIEIIEWLAKVNDFMEPAADSA